MAFDSSELYGDGDPPGRRGYKYHTTDHPDVVEAAGYFNNADDNVNLAKGDIIRSVTWSALDTGTISYVKDFIVTNVIANDAAASAGAVNVAEFGVSSAGALSSGT
jgi:hypothetical protein